MKIQTANYSLEVRGVEFDATGFGHATLAGFDSLTINGLVTLNFEQWTQFYSTEYSEIRKALDLAAHEEFLNWRATRNELNRWLSRQ